MNVCEQTQSDEVVIQDILYKRLIIFCLHTLISGCPFRLIFF